MIRLGENITDTTDDIAIKFLDVSGELFPRHRVWVELAKGIGFLGRVALGRTRREYFRVDRNSIGQRWEFGNANKNTGQARPVSPENVTIHRRQP